MEAQIMERHLQEFVEDFSPCHRNCLSERDVSSKWNKITESQRNDFIIL